MNQGPKEGEAMDIHKPKPIRNFREFLKEVGIIVLGVCIALGAEQTVEWVHWQSEVRAARSALQAEIAANNENMFAFRIATASCLDQQIAEADGIITALEAGREPGKFTHLRYTASNLTRDSEWQSERASQVLTHFPRAELAMMGRYYAQVETLRDWTAMEASAWLELTILQNPPAGITTSDLIRLRINLGIVQRTEYLTILNSKRQLALSRQLGIADPAPDPVRVNNFCTMNTADYQRYRATQDLR